MLRLKHDVIDGERCSTLDTRAILGLDFTKAFDNVKHSAILDNLGRLGLRKRVYNYVSNFLCERTATLAVGGLNSHVIELGSRGTPQGSVLSPFLFNRATMGFPKYSNRLTVSNTASMRMISRFGSAEAVTGKFRTPYNRALKALELYVGPQGLSCSSQKSELSL